jgi:tRNA uridine 5-carboxymethylaminomethyl modification enzyme
LAEACAQIEAFRDVSAATARELYLDERYAPYEAQRRTALDRLAKLADLPIPEGASFDHVPGLSAEARDALLRGRPATLGGAANLPGMNASALAVLAAHLRRRERLWAQG